MYRCVRSIDLASISTIFRLDFGTILPLWYYFDFHFIYGLLRLSNNIVGQTDIQMSWLPVKCYKYLPLLWRNRGGNKVILYFFYISLLIIIK